MSFSLNFPYAQSQPKNEAKFRTCNDDFIVNEVLGFTPTGEGEHLCIHIRKNGENTGWVAEKIADFFGVRTMDVGFCGRKDRHAITTQWFSVYLPKQKHIPEISLDNSNQNLMVLACQWHKQKLRPGAHSKNQFEIRLRDVSDLDDAQKRLGQIKKEGVPNYFGEQRFGREGGNLTLAENWFVHGETIRKQKLKGLVMSAARSYLFNLVLARHVELGSWNQLISGDMGDQPSAPLWGRGRALVTEELQTLEQDVLSHFSAWRDGLEHCGLEQERRARVLFPSDLSWDVCGRDIVIKFSLSAGEFATSVLREVSRLIALESR